MNTAKSKIVGRTSNSEPDYRSILELVDAFLLVNSLDQLSELWGRLARISGVQGAIFALSRAAPDPETSSFEIITFGVESGWANSYRLLQMSAQDPVVQASLYTGQPMTWAQAARLAIRHGSKAWRGSQFRKLALEAGLRHGVIYGRRSSYSPNLTAITALTTGDKPPTRRQCTLSSHLLPHLNEILPRSGFHQAPDLSRCEMEVLKWCAVGKSNLEIAKILNIAERTVKFHLRNIYRKLECDNRAQALSKALRIGLVSPS